MLTLNIKKLNQWAELPKFQTEGSAGMDLTAITVSTEALPDETQYGVSAFKYIYGTGLAFQIPAGHVGLLFPRSSIHKTDMQLTNCVGVIDSDYRGEVKLVFTVRPGCKTIYKVGDRVGQLVIMKLPDISIKEVEELSDTARGSGGFGSTGR